MNKRRLGRGLEALLGREEGGLESTSLDSAELLHVPIDQIDPNPFQPRRQFDPADISSLADSIRQHGMLQPVLLRPMHDRFQLIAGERRMRAAIEAHLHEIPARLMELDDQRVHELAMVENLQREDLNAMDKALAFQSYLESYGGTQEELASRIGVDRSTVANLVRLLDLPLEVQAAVRDKHISPGHARALLGLDTAEARINALGRIVDEALSVRQTEALVATGEPTPSKPRIRQDQNHESNGAPTDKPPHLAELEHHLQERFGTPVMVKLKGQNKGQFIISFQSEEEFQRLAGIMRGY